MTMFLIGLGAIAVLIAITLWVDMPPIDEFGQRGKESGKWKRSDAPNVEKESR